MYHNRKNTFNCEYAKASIPIFGIQQPAVVHMEITRSICYLIPYKILFGNCVCCKEIRE